MARRGATSRSWRLRRPLNSLTVDFREGYKRQLQPCGEIRVDTLNLVQQSPECNTKRSRKFGDIQLADQRAFKLINNSMRQLIESSPVNGWETVSYASQRQCIVAHPAEHIFCLP